MKQIKFIGFLMMMLAMSLSFVSCGGDDEKENVTDNAGAVAGIYTGKLKVGSSIVEDAYVVTITRISSTVVKVTADFYNGGNANYNVSKEGAQYIFSSESSSGINISVTGKAITMSFLNQGNTMTTFTGSRD